MNFLFEDVINMVQKGRAYKCFGYFSLFFFVFLGPHPQHIEVPKLGVESQLQLLAYTLATATPDPSHVWDLNRSSQQHWILNPLSEWRNRTCIFMDANQIRFHWATTGTPIFHILFHYLENLMSSHKTSCLLNS